MATKGTGAQIAQVGPWHAGSSSRSFRIPHNRRECPIMADPWKTYDVGGYEVLVGRDAAANEELSLRYADPADGWLHVANHSGSHVVIRNPQEGTIPREVVTRAAELAVWFSEARRARGKVPVHWCRVGDVSKRRGAPRGQVVLRRWEEVRVYPREPESDTAAED